MLLGGIAAEQLMFGEFDHGSALGEGSDLVDATRSAVMVEGVYGMGGSLIAEHHDDPTKALDIRRSGRLFRSCFFQELGRGEAAPDRHLEVLGSLPRFC